jgi:hypothetical protein
MRSATPRNRPVAAPVSATDVVGSVGPGDGSDGIVATAAATGTAVEGFGVTSSGPDGDADALARLAARVGFAVAADLTVACGLAGAAAEVVPAVIACRETHRPSQAIRIRA